MPTGLAIKALVGTTSPVHAHEWSLPTSNADGSWKPGAWSKAPAGKIQYRGNGLHVCGTDQLAYWQGHIKGKKMQVYVCEYRGGVDQGMHGFAAREVRLLRPWMGETI